MSLMQLEQVGWSHVDISSSAQDAVEDVLCQAGARMEIFDVTTLLPAYHRWRGHHEYAGDYAAYNGPLDHCLLEKILEHYVSKVLIDPRPGMTGVDVGSCQSVFPALLRRLYGVNYYEQDLDYPRGVQGSRIGSSADSIPLPESSVDFMTLHCTFEHFEGGIDSGFVVECARLLRAKGLCVILPLYLNRLHCNVTGVCDPERQATIGWDPYAEHRCLIPEWENRFGRHYSPRAFMERVYNPAVAVGLRPRLLKIMRSESIHPSLWLRWALVLER